MPDADWKRVDSAIELQSRVGVGVLGTFATNLAT